MNMTLCWEQSGLISDQHMNAGSLGLFEAKCQETVSHMERTSEPQNNTEYCWDHGNCKLLSHKVDDSLCRF